MGGGGDDPGRTTFRELVGRRADGARRVDHVVDEDAHLAVHLTDDLLGFHGVERRVVAPLVHDGQVGPELYGVARGHLHTAGVGRDDGQVSL